MSDVDAGLQLGFRAAIFTAALAIIYDVLQLLEWSGLLGSSGGPTAASTALGVYLLLTPSLLLGPAFVVMSAALIDLAEPRGRVHALAALALAAVYAALTGLVYAVQLTFVAPAIAAGKTAGLELLLFVPYRSFLFAIDLWGYAVMCLSTLVAGLALPRRADTDRARRLLILNGLLAPFLALQMFVPAFIWPASLWAITFPAACLLLAAAFRNEAAARARSRQLPHPTL